MTPAAVATRFAPFLQPGVAFDPERHAYTYDGEPVPGVTSLLRAHHISGNPESIPVATLENKRDIGTAAHAAAHYHDEGDLDLATVAPAVHGYVESWRLFCAHFNFQPLLLETPLVHPVRRYAGTLDRWGICHQGNPQQAPAIVDLKSGDPSFAAAHVQTAAYEQLVRWNLPSILQHLVATRGPLPWTFAELEDMPWMRYSVQLVAHPTPRTPYLLQPYLASQTLTHWRVFERLLDINALQHPSWRV